MKVLEPVLFGEKSSHSLLETIFLQPLKTGQRLEPGRI